MRLRRRKHRQELAEASSHGLGDRGDLLELKLLANQRDVPYQSLLKVFLAEKIQETRSGKVADDGSSTRRKSK